ncbi:MAG: hypothetical protein M1821_009353 [Bathelium mastoideum]|nr:MAG: hypothetical protein M1821_009353 [Bathelium mastoideum]
MFHSTSILCARRVPKRTEAPISKPNPYLPYQQQDHHIPNSPPSPLSEPKPNPRSTTKNPFATPRGKRYLLGGGLILFAMGFYTTSLYTSLSRNPSSTASSSRTTTTATTSSSSTSSSPHRQADFTAIYDTTASDYDALVGISELLMGMGWLRRALARRARGHTLEASVGTGRNLRWVRWGEVRSLTCVDASREMVGVARGKVKTEGQGVELVRRKLRWVVGGLGRGVPKAPPAGEENEEKEAGGGAGLGDERRRSEKNVGEAKKGNDGEEGEKMEESGNMALVGQGAHGEEGKYDTVIQSLGLCSTDDPVQLIRGLARATKSDGELVLLEHGRSQYQWLNQILDRSASEHARMHGCWWNRDIGKIVEDTGLEVLKIWRCHLGTTWWIELKPPSKALMNKWDREEARTKAVVDTTSPKRAKWWSWN